MGDTGDTGSRDVSNPGGDRLLVEAYDPFSPAVMADPHPYYRALRVHAPVHYLKRYDTFVIARMADVWRALGDDSEALLSTEGSMMRPTALRRHNRGAVPDPPVRPIGNANRFGAPVLGQFREVTGNPFRHKAVMGLSALIHR